MLFRSAADGDVRDHPFADDVEHDHLVALRVRHVRVPPGGVEGGVARLPESRIEDARVHAPGVDDRQSPELTVRDEGDPGPDGLDAPRKPLRGDPPHGPPRYRVEHDHLGLGVRGDEHDGLGRRRRDGGSRSEDAPGGRGEELTPVHSPCTGERADRVPPTSTLGHVDARPPGAGLELVARNLPSPQLAVELKRLAHDLDGLVGAEGVVDRSEERRVGKECRL